MRSASKVSRCEHEYSRSVSVLADTETRDHRPGMAGTQLLDHLWGLLKQGLPTGGLNPQTPKGPYSYDARTIDVSHRYLKQYASLRRRACRPHARHLVIPKAASS